MHVRVTVYVTAHTGSIPSTNTAALDENGNPVETIVTAGVQQTCNTLIASSDSHGL